MKVRNVLVVVALALLAVIAAGCGDIEFGSVVGTVTYEDGTPVSKATVSVGEISVETDEVGAFAFEEVPQDTYTLTVSSDGKVIGGAQVVVDENPGTISVVVPKAKKNWALGASYTYNIEPSETYPDTGGQLTDGLHAGPTYQDTNWVGHLREDMRRITVDLGAVRPIEKVQTSFLYESSVGIRHPENGRVEVSTDGKTWTRVGNFVFNPEKLDLIDGMSIPAVLDNLNVAAQYVRLVIDVDVWMFIDEIEVW